MTPMQIFGMFLTIAFWLAFFLSFIVSLATHDDRQTDSVVGACIFMLIVAVISTLFLNDSFKK